MAVDREPYASFLHTWDPSEGNGDDPGSVLGDLEECGLGHIEVLERGVAPATVVVGEGIVRGAEVGGGDGDGPGEAPLRVVVALHLVAGPAAQAVVEQSGAEGRGVGPVALAIQVAIPTSTPHGAGRITTPVEGGVSVLPPAIVGISDSEAQTDDH